MRTCVYIQFYPKTNYDILETSTTLHPLYLQMYERREVRLNPCLLLVTAVFILATAAFVPLSIKGYINIPTHCSEFRLNDPYISVRQSILT